MTGEVSMCSKVTCLLQRLSITIISEKNQVQKQLSVVIQSQSSFKHGANECSLEISSDCGCSFIYLTRPEKNKWVLEF